MEDAVKITEFPTNEISEEERIKASEKAYHQAEQSIKNERLLKSGEYPKEVIMRLEESNRIGTIRAETVQELVRCKDCVKGYKGNYFKGIACRRYGEDRDGYPVAVMEEDDFCSRGEKRQEDELTKIALQTMIDWAEKQKQK